VFKLSFEQQFYQIFSLSSVWKHLFRCNFWVHSFYCCV